MPVPGDSPEAAPSRACYNCRRRRLRCDRSRPTCRKCWSAGVDCLGYGTVLRWANAPAVRGRLVGQLSVTSPKRQPTSTEFDTNSYSVRPSLLDPLLNGLDRRERHYVHHCTLGTDNVIELDLPKLSNLGVVAVTVCRDLVSFDQHDRNPFRLIVPLAAKFNYLQAIIVATGAMHLASALFGRRGQEARLELVDALVAKDKAIRLLRSAIDSVTPADQAMVLAATVFLINIDLIDSGKGGWQAHIEAASTLMMSLSDPVHGPDQSLMPLLDAIAADCLTYRVLGSAISGVCLTSWDDDLADLLPVLRRAEPYSYHCCPPEILQILLSASSLCGDEPADATKIERALSLLHQARSLDIANWVHGIRGLSAQDDLATRVSIALAHQATACLYILLAVPEAAPSPLAVDMLVQEVLGHLDAVPVDHVHLKGTIWPTFMVGAQTDDPAQRAWCIGRMQAVWARNPWSCPWGYVRTAVQTMQDLWEARDREPPGPGRRNWLLELKRVRDKCLIV